MEQFEEEVHIWKTIPSAAVLSVFTGSGILETDVTPHVLPSAVSLVSAVVDVCVEYIKVWCSLLRCTVLYCTVRDCIHSNTVRYSIHSYCSAMHYLS
jgi:hypothetical protein